MTTVQQWESKASVIKTMTGFITKVDAAQGIVEAIVNVMGIIDQGNDLVENGAYVKTITERAGQIRALDNHRTDSISRIVGRPLLLREVGKDELPAALLQKYPEATGGLWTQTKFFRDTDEDIRIFNRVAEGLTEWSIGFDVVLEENRKVTLPDGKAKYIRVIKEIKLYEFSAVLWGMNQATVTTAVKGQTDMSKQNKAAPNYVPAQENAVQRCDGCIFFDKMGENGGYCRKYAFDCEGGYVCDSYQPGNKSGSQPGKSKEYTANGAQARVGDYISGRMYDRYTTDCNKMFIDGYVNDTEHRVMCETGLKLLDAFAANLSEDVRLRPYDKFGGMDFFLWSDGGADALKAIQAQAQKAGRVLSQRNFDRLQRAMEEIDQVLKEAGLAEDEPEPTPDQSESEAQPDTNPDGKAGSQPTVANAPTLSELEAKREELRSLIGGT